MKEFLDVFRRWQEGYSEQESALTDAALAEWLTEEAAKNSSLKCGESAYDVHWQIEIFCYLSLEMVKLRLKEAAGRMDC